MKLKNKLTMLVAVLNLALSSAGNAQQGQSLSIMRMPEIAAVREDPSCPPINKYTIAQQLQPILLASESPAYRYQLQFSPTSVFKRRLEKYLHYVQSLESAISTINTTWRIYDNGLLHSIRPPKTTALGVLLSEFSSRFDTSSNKHSLVPSNNYHLNVNHWYRVLSSTQLNGSSRFYARKCETAQYWISWQVATDRPRATGDDGRIIVSDGRKAMATFPIKLNRYSF